MSKKATLQKTYPTKWGWPYFWSHFKKNKIALIALFLFAFFFLCAVFAPFLASSKPLLVVWNKTLYFPLFRYLFYNGFYTKPIDLFFNLFMFTFPCGLLIFFFFKKALRKWSLIALTTVHFVLFAFILNGLVKNPERDESLKQKRKSLLESQQRYSQDPLLMPFSFKKSWDFELKHMSQYEKLNLLLRYKQRKEQHLSLTQHGKKYEEAQKRPIPTLWAVDQKNELQKRNALQKTIDETKNLYSKAIENLPNLIDSYTPFSHVFIMAKYELEHASPKNLASAEAKYNEILKASQEPRLALTSARAIIESYEQALSELNFLESKKNWEETESKNLRILIPALIRNFHWQDDAGGAQAFNRYLPWWELTRINRKDLASSLIFGIRVSLIVGISAVAVSLVIGIFLGTIAGYFAGKTDLFICRAIEIWEAMPTFFMLLLIVAITQSKSLFLVVAVLGLFGWTAKCRFMRAEVLKQRNLPYVLASVNLGFHHRKIMFSDILPNAIPPILTLLPFSMMAAITSEAGLSFLGLGEEGSTSWGVLMDEGRSVFPGESYLLWPPAILLTLLLISIALVGDALRDALDPKMR